LAPRGLRFPATKGSAYVEAKPRPAPSVWSLVSSIGLVYFMPQLLLFGAGMVTGGSGIGIPGLILLTLDLRWWDPAGRVALARAP